MRRWLWHGRRVASDLGVPGWFGFALLLAAALLHMGSIQPAEQEIEELQAAIQQAQAHPAALNTQIRPETRLAHFYAFFPDLETLSGQLHTLHKVTSAQDLSMGKVDYKLSNVNGTPLKRYEITYALVTDYPSLRMYLATLLESLPNAALEGITLQRLEDDDSILEAKLSLVLYVGNDHAQE